MSGILGIPAKWILLSAPAPKLDRRDVLEPTVPAGALVGENEWKAAYRERAAEL